MVNVKRKIQHAGLGFLFLIVMIFLFPMTGHAEAVDPEDPLNGRAEGQIDSGFYDDQAVVDSSNYEDGATPPEYITYGDGTEDVYGDESTEADDNGITSYDNEIEMYAASNPNNYDQITHNSAYASTTIRRGIDVSSWQGNIDWTSVKNSGVEYAFIRLGYRRSASGELGEDSYGLKNLAAAKAAGLKVGVYIFSQAINTSEAAEEAQYMLNLLGGTSLDLPIVMDYEYAGGGSGRLAEANLSQQAATDNVLAFCSVIQPTQYVPMLYANKDFLRHSLYMDQIDNKCLVWLANYTYQTDYERSYKFWQFSSTGYVNGISGYVDMDVWYDDGTPIELGTQYTGLVRFSDGKWYYLYMGQIQWNYCGFVQYQDGRWYYVNHGVIDYTANGLYPQVGGRWYYARGGVIDWSYSGLSQNCYGNWYAVRNGEYNSGFTGLLPHNNSFYYVKDGSLRWDFVGFILYQDGRWYYVDHGQVNYNMTGLCPQVGGGWYYAKGGVLDWNYTGLAQNIYGDWYAVKKGKFDNGFTGLMRHNSAFYYVKNGSLRWDYTGFVQYQDGKWYYVDKGCVNYHANGLYYDSYGKAYYTRGGVIDWSYCGFAPCEDGHTYYVNKGIAVK